MTHRDADLYGDDERMRGLMSGAQVWAVVGRSNTVGRAAYGVSAMLQRQGKTIIPVNRTGESVHGATGYRTLTEAAEALGPIDVVDVFVRSELVGPIADEAITIGASALWMQLGVIDEDAARRARAAGLLTVMDHCPTQEWGRLMGNAPSGS